MWSNNTKDNEKSNKNLKKFFGPFCCWVALRRKRIEKRRKILKNNNQIKKRPYFPLEEGNNNLNNNNNQLFGIPIHSPTEYYSFLEKYFNWGEQQNNENKKLVNNNNDDCWDCCTCPSTSNNNKKLIYGQLNVSIKKKSGQQLGLGIAGGSDKPMPPTISYLKPGFIAHRCDQIQVGDRLIEVNGIKVNKGFTHSKVLSLLRNSDGNLLELKLEYNLNSNQLLNNKNEGIITKTTEIELFEEILNDKEDYGLFGILIRGGAFGPDLTKNRPITITSIRVGSSAHREGRLRPGDRIIAINGICVIDSTLSDAINLIKTSPFSKLNLTVEYNICNLVFLNKIQQNSLNVEIEKTPGINFGIELLIKQLPIWPNGSRRAIIINKLIPASIAERCGLIQLNDELLTIDLISLKLINNLNEVYQLLNSLSSVIRLELLPAKLRGNIILKENNKNLSQNDGFGGFEFNFNKNIISSSNFSSSLTSTQKSSKWKRKGSVSARLSYNNSKIIGSINHTEAMEISLAQETTTNWPSFGIILGKQKLNNEENDLLERGEDNGPLVIIKIEKGSPADKCGVLQPGDRILCIDDWHTAEGTLEEAIHLLRILSLSANRSVILLVEFDVIEPVLPPSHGSFFVMRLAKCGKCIGIVCQSNQNNGITTKGEPLIISHIRIGSVAHRCGSIQIGDQIHSIDDIPLNTCTLDEAMRLLQRSARIIKLVIIKGGGQEQHLMEEKINQNFIYTIELLRRGRPLGITIASSGGHLDPIIISKLATNGLAERTGALNIGDQILSVNGESLEGKKISQVTQILQKCSDPILLKLCRSIASPTHLENNKLSYYNNLRKIEEITEQNNNKIFGINSTPKKSVDSAMESLESSPPGRQGIPLYSSLRRPSTSTNTQQTATDPLLSTYSDPYSCSGGGNGGLDSGLSSAAATNSQTGGNGHNQQSSHLNSQGKCCECQFEINTSGNHSFCCLNSPNSSSDIIRKGKKQEENNDDEWMRILEALETVSEAEMLRKLEECILNGSASNYVPLNKPRYGFQQMFPSELGNILSHQQIIQSNNNNYDIVDNKPIETDNTKLIKKSQRILSSDEINLIKCVDNNYSNQLETQIIRSQQQQQNGESLPPSMPSPRISAPPFTIASTFASSEKSISSTSLPSCTIYGQNENNESTNERKLDKFDELSEVFSVQLKRCPFTKSFGFSVCDGPLGEENEIKEEFNDEKISQSMVQLSTGIYIRSIVKNGPAEKSGRIQPKDRILQINGRSIQFLTCDLVLPLLTTEFVDLLLLRKRKNEKIFINT